MDALLGEMCGILEEGRPVVLATIFDHQGSTPRTSGARMIIRADGTIAGTIGGGLLEARVIRRAASIFETGCSVVEHFALNAATVDSMDMICGGNLSVLLEFIAADPENRQLFSAWRRLTVEQGAGWVLTLLPEAHRPALPSAKCLIEPDGSITGRMLSEGIDLSALLTACRHLRKPTVITDRRNKIHIEPVACRENLILFGAGHVSQSVAALAHTVGFGITVVDDRPEFANRERFGSADEILVPASFDRAVEGLSIDCASYIVIVTRGHLHDHTVLARALKTNAGYIGMIGSKRKRNAIYAALSAAGFTQDDLERVYSPIGLDIGAETPEEIAVSIVSQLIAVRAGRRKRTFESAVCRSNGAAGRRDLCRIRGRVTDAIAQV